MIDYRIKITNTQNTNRYYPQVLIEGEWKDIYCAAGEIKVANHNVPSCKTEEEALNVLNEYFISTKKVDDVIKYYDPKTKKLTNKKYYFNKTMLISILTGIIISSFYSQFHIFKYSLFYQVAYFLSGVVFLICTLLFYLSLKE